jgi:hypothetical protein
MVVIVVTVVTILKLLPDARNIDFW